LIRLEREVLEAEMSIYDLFCRMRRLKGWICGIWVGSDAKPIEPDLEAGKEHRMEREQSAIRNHGDGSFTITMRARH